MTKKAYAALGLSLSLFAFGARGATNTAPVRIEQNEPPNIEHVPVLFVHRSEPVLVQAKVTDQSGEVKRVSLYYALSQQAVPSEVPMKRITKTQYTGLVPANFYAMSTKVWYYISAVDTLDDKSDTTWYPVTIQDQDKEKKKEEKKTEKEEKPGETARSATVRTTTPAGEPPSSGLPPSGSVGPISGGSVGPTPTPIAEPLSTPTLTGSSGPTLGGGGGAAGPAVPSGSAGPSGSVVPSGTSVTPAVGGGVGAGTIVVGGIVLGGAVVGGVALAGNSGGGHDGGEITEASLVGNWHVTSPQWPADHYADATLNDGNTFTYTEHIAGTGYSGTGTWSYDKASNFFSMNSDGGASFSGTVEGNSNAFDVSGNFAGGGAGTTHWERR